MRALAVVHLRTSATTPINGDLEQPRQDIAGRTVYLALSCEQGGAVRMKPQNLLTNLPLREA